MRRSIAVLTAAVLMAVLLVPVRAEEKKQTGHQLHLSPVGSKCLKACTMCAAECSSCFVHCTEQVAAGKKEHVNTLKSCLDCGDICVLAAKVMSRDGPLAQPICDGCAKACDACAANCEKFPHDEHMKACAKACRDCAKACREMVGAKHHEVEK